MTTIVPSLEAEKISKSWWTVAVLAVSTIFAYMDRQLLALFIEPIRTDLRISDTQVSFITGLAFSVCYTLAALPLAKLADRANRRTIVAAAFATWSLMTAMCGISQNYVQLLIARMAVGTGEAAYDPASQSLVADLFPARKLALPMAVFALGMPIGGGLAYLAGGTLIRLVQGLPGLIFAGVPLHPWQMCFLIIGLGGFLASLGVWSIAEPRSDVRRALTVENGLNRESIIGYLVGHRALFAPLLLAVATSNIFAFGVLAWLPSFFVRGYGTSVADAGSAIGALILLFGCTGSIVGGWVCGIRMRRNRLDGCVIGYATGLIIMLAGTITMSLSPTEALALLSVAVIVFGLYYAAACYPTIVQLVAPRHLRGRMSTTFGITANLAGLGLGPTAIALITDYGFGRDSALGWSILISALVFVIPSVILLFYIRGHYHLNASRLADMPRQL